MTLGWFALIPVLVAGICAYFLSRTFLNHDVAWVLYGSRTLLSGGQFGIDIIAANPPLIWWLYHLPTTAAHFLGAPIDQTFRAFILGLAALSLCVNNLLLAQLGYRPAHRTLFLTVAAFVFTLGTYRDFGQREHITLMLTLPYVLAASLRHDGGKLRTRWGFAIGVLAGVGIALKPYFVTVPIMVEMALLLRFRNPAYLWRPEAIGALSVVVLYAVAIIIWASPWLVQVIPSISQVYWAFEGGIAGSLWEVITLFIIPFSVALLVLRVTEGWRHGAMWLSLLAAFGFMLSATIQNKYYSYHLYPAFSLIVFFYLLAIKYSKGKKKKIVAALSFIFSLQIMVTPVIWLRSSLPQGAVYANTSELVEFVRKRVPSEGAYLAISSHPFPGFPITLYANRDWASASNSRIYLPAIVRLRRNERGGDQALLDYAEKMEREAIRRDLARQPDLVLIDIRPRRHAIGVSDFDYLNFYMEDGGFRKLWSKYEQVPSPRAGFAAYALKKDDLS